MNLAAQGLRNMDEGNEKIEDQDEINTLQEQAKGVHIRALAAGVILTALAFLV